MWRNHHAGSIRTDIAAALCDRVFCTSKYSYTARYKKTVLMPVGIDTDLFRPLPDAVRDTQSLLFLARMSPVKKPHVLLGALSLLKEKHQDFRASFYGDPSKKDVSYYVALQDKVRALGLEAAVVFHAGVPNDKTVAIYGTHGVFVNLSSSGMYDKTIFEAMACGTLVLASNENLRGLIDDRFIFREGDPKDLAMKLQALLKLSPEDTRAFGRSLRETVVEKHSLALLAEKMFAAYSSRR